MTNVLLAIMLAPAAASAGELELSAHAGAVFPFYEETFEFDPGGLPGLPFGTTVEQVNPFRLDAHGGIALGLSVAWQFSDWLGVEARLDTADVTVRMTGARYRIATPLPGPIPDLVNELDLGSGDADLQRILPLSLNLRARTSGRTRFGASAGISYLPSFHIAIRQEATFSAVSPIPFEIASAQLALDAEALPEDEGEGRVGFNAGAFVQLDLGSRLLLQIEGRYFHFQQQTLTWETPQIDPPLPFPADILVDQLAERLEPVEFNPTFFQITAGIGIRF
jgi:hypothetical protein